MNSVTSNHYKTFTIIFFVLFMLTAGNKENNNNYVNNYLCRYGYLKKNNNKTESIVSDLNNKEQNNYNISNVLREFQDKWNLPIDGTFNEKTVEFMQKSRCGVEDSNILEYNIHVYKWIKRKLNWYFHEPNEYQLKIAKYAFSKWEEVTKFKFFNVESIKTADLIIYVTHMRHRFLSIPHVCEYDLEPHILGHAYLPTEDNDQLEIHIPIHIEWDLSLGDLQKDKISFYWVLMHEIGHTLGLRHSTKKDSLMYPIYRKEHNNTNVFPFNYDDLNAIDDLDYNTQINTTITSTTTTTTTTTTATALPLPTNIHHEKILKSDDFCKIPPGHLKFFIYNNRFYIFYEKWVWPLNLDNNNRKYEKPKLIKSLLTFLPSNFESISGIFETSFGDIVLFSTNQIYVFNPTSLRLLPGWPKSYQTLFGEQFTYDGVQAAVLTNRGKILVVYDSVYVMQLDDCSFYPQSYYLFMELFKGISLHKQSNFSIFKYNNGKLYIIDQDKFYEYDEYNSFIVRSDAFDLTLFHINCPMEATINKLQRLVSKLLHYYSDEEEEKEKYNLYLNEMKEERKYHNNDIAFKSTNELKDYINTLF